MTLPEVRGFRFHGLSAGIKESGRSDLALIATEAPVPAAAVFTRNRVRAAPVEIAKERLRSGKIQAALVNSGNANACTGAAGEKAALRSCEAIAAALGIDPTRVVPASTGVIGVKLESVRIETHAEALVDGLSADGADRFATAILTTDKAEKVSHRQLHLERKKVNVLGIAKGAGMIHPDMATTLAFVVTDAAASAPYLRKCLRRATDATFNRISVDGDTSTNDMILLMASGAADHPPLRGESRSSERFEAAVRDVLEDLALEIVADGEGAEHAVKIEIKGAASPKDARRAAKAIATSQLVKTAIHGCDPNWGRIIAAAGRSGARFDPEKARVRIGEVCVFDRGAPVGKPRDEEAASALMRAPRYTIEVGLGAGKSDDYYFTSDLGHGYVSINADYRT